MVFLFELIVPIIEIIHFNVSHAKTVPSRLVHIGGSDALQCGADLVLSLGLFRCSVQEPMCGQDQMRLSADDQTVHAGRFDLLEFLDLTAKDHRIDHHAIAHDIHGL